MVLSRIVLFTFLNVLLAPIPSTTRNLGNVFLLLVADVFAELVEGFESFVIEDSRSASWGSFGVGGEHEGDVLLCADMLIFVLWWRLTVCHQD